MLLTSEVAADRDRHPAAQRRAGKTPAHTPIIPAANCDPRRSLTVPSLPFSLLPCPPCIWWRPPSTLHYAVGRPGLADNQPVIGTTHSVLLLANGPALLSSSRRPGGQSDGGHLSPTASVAASHHRAAGSGFLANQYYCATPLLRMRLRRLPLGGGGYAGTVLYATTRSDAGVMRVCDAFTGVPSREHRPPLIRHPSQASASRVHLQRSSDRTRSRGPSPAICHSTNTPPPATHARLHPAV